MRCPRIDKNHALTPYLLPQLSKDEPKDCYLLEVRASPTTKVSALAAMASKSKSKSLDPNQKRLAFILIDQECAKYMEEDKYVKEAILAGPITEKGVINKVHVVFHSKHVRVINGVPNFQPVPEGAPPLPRFEYKLIPFPGYNVDGTLAAKSGQQQGKKKTPAGSSK